MNKLWLFWTSSYTAWLARAQRERQQPQRAAFSKGNLEAGIPGCCCCTAVVSFHYSYKLQGFFLRVILFFLFFFLLNLYQCLVSEECFGQPYFSVRFLLLIVHEGFLCAVHWGYKFLAKAPFQADFKRTLLTLPPCCNTGFCGKITASAIHLESPLYPSRVPLLQHLGTGLGDRVSSQPGNCIQVNGLFAVKQTEMQTSTASD